MNSVCSIPAAVSADTPGRVLLTHEEEIALASRVEQGDRLARERLVTANQGLVIKLARKYCRQGMDLADLVQEGNVGLIQAVEHFDAHKGYRFSTYATFWIAQAIRKAAFPHGQALYLPQGQQEALVRLKHLRARLFEAWQREPTAVELAEHLACSVDQVDLLLRGSQAPASLEQPLDEGDGDRTLAEGLVDSSDDPSEVVEARERLQTLLSALNARERLILMEHYDLDGGGERTLAEVGRHLGVSRERARQLEEKALYKLRKLIEQEEQHEK